MIGGLSSGLLFSLFVLASPAAGAAEGAIWFRDVAGEWGVDFVHHHGGSGERYMVETMVGGVVVFDYDGDGDRDLLFVDGGVLPGYEGEAPRTRLLRNDGAGGEPRFVDVTAAAGIALPQDFYGAGGTAGDVDSDGDLDLYLTAFGGNRLLRNRGDGTFEEVTAAAGVGDERWSMPAAFADPDVDGDLDLFVANYVDFSVDNHVFCGDRERGIRGYCHPDVYDPVGDRYYRNRGDGTFDDATEVSGLARGSRGEGAGLGAVWGDLDGDALPDLYVANDLTPNFLYRNRGDGAFEEVSLMAGTAYSDRGRPEAGMGVDLGDGDGDGRLDIVVTNFELETNAFYANVGSGLFFDRRWPSGLAEPSLRMLAFGIAFADFDHDGDLDLAVANGHLNDNAAELDPESRYRQPNQLFESLGAGRFAERRQVGLDGLGASRGLAVGDLDGDGDLEVVVVNSNEAAECYENVSGAATGSWLQVDLVAASGNRFGVGARLTLEGVAAGPGVPAPQVREVKTASSYLSQNAMTAHFGLGAAASARLTVRWPDGRVQVLEGLPGGRRLRLVRGDPR